MGPSDPTTYESRVVHVSGAITIPAGGREQLLLTALDGLIAISAGLDAARGPARDGPYVAIVNAGADPLSYAQDIDGQLRHGSLVPGRSVFALPPAADVGGGERRTLQIQIGPVRVAATAAEADGGADVLTLVLSAEDEGPGAVAFVGQGIGGRAG